MVTVAVVTAPVEVTGGVVVETGSAVVVVSLLVVLVVIWVPSQFSLFSSQYGRFPQSTKIKKVAKIVFPKLMFS